MKKGTFSYLGPYLGIGLLAMCGSAQAYAESFLQASAGSQFYQEASSLGKGINTAGCFPTSLAYSIRYQKYVRTPNYSALPSPSADATEDNVQASEWMQFFFDSCGTSDTTGTSGKQQLDCIRSFYESSGYKKSWVYEIGPFSQANPPGQRHARAVTVDDIKTYLDQGYSLILDLAWIAKVHNSSQWMIDGGHSVAIVGYNYDPSWGENKIVLDVMDPARGYYGDASSEIFSKITMESRAVHPEYEITNASDDQAFVLTGFNYQPPFGNPIGLVNTLVVFAPEKL
jgi:hypothetical protein